MISVVTFRHVSHYVAWRARHCGVNYWLTKRADPQITKGFRLGVCAFGCLFVSSAGVFPIRLLLFNCHPSKMLSILYTLMLQVLRNTVLVSMEPLISYLYTLMLQVLRNTVLVSMELVATLRVQVPNYHILSKMVTYITTIRNLST